MASVIVAEAISFIMRLIGAYDNCGVMMRISLIKKIAYIYLLIPVLIFCAGWLNGIMAILLCCLIVGSLISLFPKESQSDFIHVKPWNGILTLVVLIIWVGLSGIGGYAFQNWDHHSRNAVFSDLINFSWPVSYHLDAGVAQRFGAPPDVILSYYFGFWLPAAVVGKISGPTSANLFLFLWSLLGLFLSILLIASRIKLSLIKTTLLIIFFSGADIVGAWMLENIAGDRYPGLWPPIQHLEWWAGSLQYSSFTTSLFWTYNQFIPAFLILSLFINSKDNQGLSFLTGICFFFAPLPALGLIPFTVGLSVEGFLSFMQKSRHKVMVYFSTHLFAVETISGILIAILSLIFFSTNISAQSRGFGLPASFALYLIFLALDGMLIWLLLLPLNKTWVWYIAGSILALAPFVRVGGSWDFMLRTTLPSLYILMIGCGVYISDSRDINLRSTLLIMLLFFGAFTPIYEINRSVVRTDRYYGYRLFPFGFFEGYFDHPPKTNQGFIPETDHMGTLVADDWLSVSIPNSEGWNTKVGNRFASVFSLIFKDKLIQ